MPDPEFIPRHPKVPKSLAYDRAKELARDPDAVVRLALAEHPDAPPEVLYFLAEDDDIAVRRAVACNENTPRKADLLLTDDIDPEVRHSLAGKIGRLTESLPEDKRRTAYKMTVQILETLAEDQTTRIRAILSDTLKSLPNAPQDVVKKLALDRELQVAEPVLEFSPVLSDQDLIGIIYSDPVQGAIGAITRRAAVAEGVSDAIVSRGSDEEIRQLLENREATISETTMGRILDKAEEQPDWHSPLAQRPQLSRKTVQRLANFLAMNLLDQLQKRVDLDDDTLVVLAQTMEKRLQEEEAKDGQDEDETAASVLEHVENLHRAGRLTTDKIEEAFDEGDRQFVIAAVSCLSGIPLEKVSETFGAQRPQRIVSICWTAGLSAHFARLIQVQMARVQPHRVIGPTDKGDFALKKKEMKELLKAL